MVQVISFNNGIVYCLQGFEPCVEGGKTFPVCHHDHIRGDRQVTDLFLHLVPDGVAMVADTFSSGVSLCWLPVVPSRLGFSSQRPCRLNVSWQVPRLILCCKLDLQPLTFLLLKWVPLFILMYAFRVLLVESYLILFVGLCSCLGHSLVLLLLLLLLLVTPQGVKLIKLRDLC